MNIAPLSDSGEAGRPYLAAVLRKLVTTSTAVNTARESQPMASRDWLSRVLRIFTSVPSGQCSVYDFPLALLVGLVSLEIRGLRSFLWLRCDHTTTYQDPQIMDNLGAAGAC